MDRDPLDARPTARDAAPLEPVEPVEPPHQTRQQTAAFEVLTALLFVLDAWGLTTTATPWNLSINFHGAARRLDIATLTKDGQHLESYVLGINLDIVDGEHFGTAVSLPAQGSVQ